ncbi:PH domain-containing protein [Bacillus sp. Xin]|uniref:PH domain-containing protein n=1 Tax=unclassified Bacillus (in: firmicutes) TaxID=185979 RepID=UPI0015716F93|nr:MULTISPECIES: PH domain-containing protein [unclassified Bacillus (in: firmicutes)]MBC6976107.1 PH domain-containing protein [Bacillus sp. Xin]NSW37289.1 PH domain-containing protein [Bacillus sp. Xin1]
MYKRQHPITILFDIRISSLIPLIIIVLLDEDGVEPWYWFPIFIVGFVLILAIFSFVKWYFKVYWIENNILHIKQGVFVKKESYLNKERVQTISTTSNIIYQLFELTKLKIETAGGGSEPEVTLAGIKEEEAKELIALLNKVEDEKPVKEEEGLRRETNTTVYQLTAKEILLASITSGQFGLLFSGLFFLYTQFDNVLPKWLIEEVETYVKDNSVYNLLYMVAILIVISWIISTIGYALKHANFTVQRNGNEIRISQGLFEKKEMVLKLHRIQALTMKEGILRQPFGYCSMEVEVIQSIDTKNMNVILHPLMKKKDVQELLTYLKLPYEIEEEIVHLPKAALRRYLIMGWMIFGAIAAPIIGASMYFQQYSTLFVLIPLFLFITILAYGKYKTGGYAIKGDQVTLVHRGIAKYTGFMKKRHVQAMTKSQSYFQRGDRLYTYIVVVACSVAGRHYELKHVCEEDVACVHEWYKEK